MSRHCKGGRTAANAHRGLRRKDFVPMVLAIMLLMCVARAHASDSYVAVSRTSAIERCGHESTHAKSTMGRI